MKWTRALLVGMTLAWGSLCVGMEEYVEPTTDVGVGQDGSVVGDPGEVVTYEVTGAEPEGEYTITSEGPGEGDVVGSETDGDSGEIEPIYMVTSNDGSESGAPGAEQIYEIAVQASGLGGFTPGNFVPEGGFEAIDPLPGDVEIPTLAPDTNKEALLAQFAGTITATVGTPEDISNMAASALNQHLWTSTPQSVATHLGVNVDMAAQMAECSQAFNSLPVVAGTYGNVTAEISAGVQEAFSAFPEVSSILAGQ